MNNNILETLEKCFTNFDILFDLFKYFDLKEQIKLTGVCTLFGDIIINYIWKYKYGELKVISIPSNYIITNIISEYPNELEIIQECSTLLSETEFEEFFNKNAGNIKKLFVTKNERQKIHIEIKLGNKFKNLLELTYKDVGVQSDNFEKLAQNCTKLERLCVQNCYNSEGCILTHIDVVTLEKMKSLKCLEIYVPHYFIQSSYIDEILQKLKLQTLKINDVRYLTNTEANIECGVDRTESLSESYPCEELVLGRLSNIRSDKFITSLLSYMKNLRMLHLIGPVFEADVDIIIQILQEQCTKLMFLQLNDCTITPFTPMHSLTHLIIEKCLGLTWKDMEIILSVMKLTAFTSHNTEYSGAYKCFEVSETLKYLDYDDVDYDDDTDNKMDRLFQTDNYNFKNLTTLKLKGSFLRLGRNIATVCPNLQLLKVRADTEFINQISRLKSLKKLELFYKNRMKEADLLTLLKHSSLNYLKMRSCGYDDDDYENDELLLADIRQIYYYQTNLLFLDMDVDMFGSFADYWLGLFSRNSRLNIHLHCSNDGTWKYFLRELKNHPKLPKRLKSIKINGFNIDIKDLRENFDETYHWIKPISVPYEEFTIRI